MTAFLFRSPILLPLITAIATVLPTAIAQALPAVILTQDVGSAVNVRSGPTTTAAIVHQGYTGDRVTILRSVTPDEDYPWHYVRLLDEDEPATGWIRDDLLLLGSDSPPIRSGIYWVGPIGMGMEVEGDRYRIYDEMGNGPWQPVDTLSFIQDGVMFDGTDYWCLSTLQAPNAMGSGVQVCTDKGWVFR